MSINARLPKTLCLSGTRKLYNPVIFPIGKWWGGGEASEVNSHNFHIPILLNFQVGIPRHIFWWKSHHSIMTARCNVTNPLIQVFPNEPFVWGGSKCFRFLVKYFNPRKSQYTSGNQNPYDCIYLANIRHNQYYQYVVIHFTYMEPEWQLTDKPRFLGHHNI